LKILNAGAWLKEGIWEKAILGLGDCEGAALTPAYQFPSMEVTIKAVAAVWLSIRTFRSYRRSV
jgi:hypothetical protein